MFLFSVGSWSSKDAISWGFVFVFIDLAVVTKIWVNIQGSVEVSESAQAPAASQLLGPTQPLKRHEHGPQKELRSRWITLLSK